MAFHSNIYWEDRYKQNLQPFDWYMQFPHFQKYVLPHITPDSNILVVGGGTSRLPFQLYDMGFQQITVVDYAKAAYDAMREMLELRPGMRYEIANANSFKGDGQYDLIIDKGCIDCILATPGEPIDQLQFVLENIYGQMKPEAKWISITFDLEREQYIKEATDKFSIQQETIKLNLLANDVQQVYYVQIMSKQ